ncbi:phage tail spike protein [Clostridium beijerinckii]|uniref:Phage minor structural protein n=2 Tax=Clostridium beijerinckii TaxID=1520 RepID=A0A9Q5CIL6_CLOBE|nr:phage tail spike protein [Clostridium beijerinckii]AQS04178.1 prophage endopeptidase tail [Clostridium beijerinckii]MBA2883931.1 phage minor structural protein [Clostridium beijerinckii]MBA2899116.1 phage minor structural protein [Clostridium beijerinckii]MBA2908516.1 phage minor structural protein [Clostridium beijerinckii]MBA9016270.1 phage minor structural protein [Clostridium beijerinckii]
MVRLFNSRETDFSHNEYVLNEIISCKVTEELNGDYTLELEYPLDDSKGISNNLVVGAIISVPTIDSRENQLFRVIKKETNSNSITVQAQAKLMADLKVNAVRAATITGKTRKEAIQTILNSALDSHVYTAGSLDTNTNTDVILQVSEGNLLSDLIGSENSVLSEYGGEFIVSNNALDIVNKRGQDNGVVIEHGKNISSIKEDIDITDFATALIPKSGDYRIPEYLIVSPNAGAYDKLYCKEVDLNLNIWDGTNDKGEDQVTIEEAYALMRTACSKIFTVDKVDQITFNYEVDFVQLSQTEEYKNYAILETVNLGDTVTVRHKVLNLDLQGRVNKIAYRVDSEGNTTIDTVEIGFSKKEITDIIKDTVKQIKFAKDEISLEVKNTDRKLSARLDIQEEKIDAVVEQDGTGFGWELSKSAFKVACVGASNAYVIIDADGLEVHDGKFRLYKDSHLVFYVNTNGRCTADGGFVVDDGDATYKLDRNGLTMTNENGYTSRIYVDQNKTTLVSDDDFQINNTLRVLDTSRFDKYAKFSENVDVDGDLYVDGTLTINGDSLEDIIDARIHELT